MTLLQSFEIFPFQAVILNLIQNNLVRLRTQLSQQKQFQSSHPHPKQNKG